MEKPRILIVEDEIIIARNIEEKLLDLGYTVSASVTSGAEAIKQTKGNRPDLILMDIKLSGRLDGIQTAEKIHSLFDLPVVYLSAYADDDVLKRIMTTDTFGYIRKPFESRELRVNIEIALYKHMIQIKLIKSEERYRDLVEKAGIAILIDDEEGNLKYFNHKFTELFGYTEAQMKRQTIQSLVYPDDVERVMDIHTQRIKGKAPISRYEFRAKRKDGSTVFLEVDAVRIHDDRRVIGTRSYIWDITPRRKIEEALIENEKKYKSLYSMVRLMCDNVPDLIWAKDLRKKFIFSNHAICEKLLNAKNTDEPIDKSDMYFANRERKAHSENPDYHTFGEICLDSDAIVMKSKKPQRFDEFGNVKGKYLFLDVHKAPFWDEQGNLIGTVGCGRDVTKEKILEEERKRVEEELINSREVLRNLSAHLQSIREEERTHISREIHDELGQALTALKMDLYWLNNRLPSDQKPLLNKTESMLKLLDKTIQTVKKISTELRPGLLDDLGLVAAIEWQADEFQNRTGIKCNLKVKSEDIVFEQDMATALFRIFQEALTNVTRHARASLVRIHLRKDKGNIVLQVIDNGIGITEKQISNPQSLGLIGIKERVHPFNGNVLIQGKKDQGTTLTVMLPFNENSSSGGK